MRAIDLFSGTGAATLGMQQAGVDVVAGIERDARTALAYSDLTGVETVVSDVGALHSNATPTFDLAWASPPCHPYSASGRQCSVNDARDKTPTSMTFVDRFHVTTTTTSNAGYVVHGGEYWRVRRREATLLQSLPWPLPRSVTAKHVGNAVPPPLVQAVVEGLIE